MGLSSSSFLRGGIEEVVVWFSRSLSLCYPREKSSRVQNYMRAVGHFLCAFIRTANRKYRVFSFNGRLKTVRVFEVLGLA